MYVVWRARTATLLTALPNQEGEVTMRFMNEYEIDRVRQQFRDHPILGPAVETLNNVKNWSNANSDGWAYWPKPTRAAKKLIEFIEGDALKAQGASPAEVYFDTDRDDATAAAYRKAVSPLKAFRTRQGADFQIVEV